MTVPLLRATLLLAFAAALPLAAQDTATPSGEIRFVEEGGAMRVLVGETEIPFDPPPYFAWLQDRAGTLALIGVNEGRNACPARFAWVHTAPGDLRRSEIFGTCSELIEITSDAETVTVTMPRMALSEGSVAFVYDGQGVTEVALGLPPAPVGPEAGADALVGLYLFDLTGTEDWRAPLTALLGPEGYARAQALTGQGGPMEVEGDWVAGTGCRPHRCDETAAAIAVHRGDGRLLVALWDSEGGLGLWGDAGGPPPASVAGVMAMAAR